MSSPQSKKTTRGQVYQLATCQFVREKRVPVERLIHEIQVRPVRVCRKRQTKARANARDLPTLLVLIDLPICAITTPS
jgi:hypothetical protein